MKTRTLLATALLAAAAPAFADDSGCFPGCIEAPVVAEAPAPTLELCRHGAVREVYRIERELRPVKEIYDIATNPTGFVIKTVSEQAGVKIPRWVGYAMDPQGSLRSAAMKRVRAEVKKHAGLANDCAEPALEDDEGDGPFPTPERDSVDA
jgi:hypothetical protein